MKTLVICLLIAGALAAPPTKPHFKRGRSRIVGGTDVAPGELPYQISFQDISWGDPFHFCGGSIYSENWAITAGHCVAGEDFENPYYIQIVAGENDMSKNEGTEQMRDVTKIIQHEDYDSYTISNDISLLKFSSPLKFDSYTKAIALPEQMQSSSGLCVVSGWGSTTEGGYAPDVLQKVSVPIVSDDECRDSYGSSSIFDSMICAGYTEGGKDSCQGDSGGPLACTSSDGSTYLGGVVSWGYGCARPGSPGVYTEVAYFADWVKANAR